MDTTALALAGSLLLLMGGLALLVHTTRSSRHRVAQRIGLVLPAPLTPLQRAGAPMRQASAQEQEAAEIIRLCAPIGVRPEHARLAFTLIGLGLAAALAGVVWLAWHIEPPLLPVAIAIGSAVVGWLLPIWIVRVLVRQSSEAAADGLPDALELMVICVEAGLSLEDALDRVVLELRDSQPALAEQLAITAADLKILPSRDQALSSLAQRVDRPAMRSVVTTLAQTMRYGTPLAQAMRVVAGEMRHEALIALEEKANRLPVLMTVPLMLFIMPTIFLVVAGPAVLHLIDTFLR